MADDRLQPIGEPDRLPLIVAVGLLVAVLVVFLLARQILFRSQRSR